MMSSQWFANTVSALSQLSPSTAVTDVGNAYNVVPAQSYRLPTSPATAFNYVPQIGTVPIIGSDVTARAYSPFTISILPPLLYLQNPDLLFGENTERSTATANGKPLPPIDLGIIGKASVGNLTNFRSTVTRLRSLSQEGANLTRSGGIAPPSQNPRAVVGGRVANRPIGGSGGGTSSTDGAKIDYAITDQKVAQDMANQLNRILNVPPLTLYINPTQLQTSFNKIQQYQDRSRYGYIYHTWGEEQPKLSVSGKIGAFLAGKTGPVTNVADGVQFASKRNSASFQQLMNLLVFFKNNGYIQDTIGKSATPLMVGIVSIEYDQNTYLGYFDSFSWGYTEMAQNGGIEFSFEFTVTQQYDNSQSVAAVAPLKAPVPSPSDPRYSPRLGSLTVGNPPQNQIQQPSVIAGSPPPAAPNAGFSTVTRALQPSSRGFRPPQGVTLTPANTVRLQSFFDPRTV